MSDPTNVSKKLISLCDTCAKLKADLDDLQKRLDVMKRDAENMGVKLRTIIDL